MHGHRATQVSVLGGKLRIRGTVGALVGPPWSKREVGCVLQETGGIRVYYEPHASFDAASLREVAPVDVVISPTTSTYAAGFPLVEGLEGVPSVVRLLRPQVVVPLINNTVRVEGVLGAAISAAGTNDPAAVEAWLAQQGVTVSVAGPQAIGQSLPITLPARMPAL